MLHDSLCLDGPGMVADVQLPFDTTLSITEAFQSPHISCSRFEDSLPFGMSTVCGTDHSLSVSKLAATRKDLVLDNEY